MCYIIYILHSLKIWRGIKFGGELNLVVWLIDQPAAKLKSTNFVAHCEAVDGKWVWCLGWSSCSSQFLRVQNVVDMSLYKFFTKTDVIPSNAAFHG